MDCCFEHECQSLSDRHEVPWGDTSVSYRGGGVVWKWSSSVWPGSMFMRPRIPDLRLALVGRFAAHHAVMLKAHLSHIDYLDAQIAAFDTEVERVIAPFDDQLRRLMTIPGVGRRTAEVVIAEIGVDMGRFPTAGHLASWAGLCPGHHEFAGKSRSGRARKGNAALRVALCEAAWAGVRKNDSYPRSPVPSLPAPVRQEGRGQGDLRVRSQPDRHDLPRPSRTLRRIRRPRSRLVHPPRRHRRPHPTARPPTRKARTPRQPDPGRLTYPATAEPSGLRPDLWRASRWFYFVSECLYISGFAGAPVGSFLRGWQAAVPRTSHDAMSGRAGELAVTAWFWPPTGSSRARPPHGWWRWRLVALGERPCPPDLIGRRLTSARLWS